MLEALLDPTNLGWRGVAVWAVVVLALYVLFLLLRMLRLSRTSATEADRNSFERIRRAKLQPYLDQGMTDPAAIGDRQPLFVADEPDLAWREAPQRFAEEQLRAGLEREVAALRDDLTALREELDGLRDAFSALREDTLKDLAALRAQQGIGAFYREAMSLAESGRSADEIATRCGIARAEADLVLALTQGRKHPAGAQRGVDG